MVDSGEQVDEAVDREGLRRFLDRRMPRFGGEFDSNGWGRASPV
jgi:hypothetical protein